MNVDKLYKAGYALGTGAKVKNIKDGDTYVLGNVADYRWVAINVRTGDRHRDVCPFSCAFQADRASAEDALGNLSQWVMVANKVLDGTE